MNPLQNFVFEENIVRITDQDGEPWFILNDVCKVLGIKNARQVASRMDADEKGVIINDTLGGPQEMTIINRPGLADLLSKSHKPVAKRFWKWVKWDILETLFKTGVVDLRNTNPIPEADIEGVPFFNPNNVYAPLSVRSTEVQRIGKKFGPQAELAASRLYGLGDFSGFLKQAASAQGQECLAHLLNAVIDDGLTVREHIKVAYEQNDEMYFPLWRNGIRAAIDPPSGIWVASKSELLTAIFNGSPWAGGRHSKALRGLSSVPVEKNQKFPARIQSTTIFIPLGLVLDSR